MTRGPRRKTAGASWGARTSRRRHVLGSSEIKRLGQTRIPGTLAQARLLARVARGSQVASVLRQKFESLYIVDLRR